jgi:hypothetical protein
MSRFVPVVLAVSLSLFAISPAHAAAPAATAAPPPRFSFVAMGCMPYGKQNFVAYDHLLEEINRYSPTFTVHCGDTKSGSEPPTEAFLLQVKDWFDSLNTALIYTPGDNEWTDVNRVNNGNQDPLVWLGKVRKMYFSEERSMGRKPIPLITQRRDPPFAKFVENARWSHGGVVFATVHVVGSNNNRQPKIPGAMEEFEERDRANAAWVRATFAEARTTRAPGVALFFQAEPFNSLVTRKDGTSGFTQFLATIEEEARAFGKPVLLVNADEHRYRLEHGMRFRAGGDPVPNVTRLETFGAGNIHAVFVTVDPASPHVFLAGPLIVPANPLPVLPRKK